MEDPREAFEETVKVVKEREVNLASITLASLIASLSELGILTQGTVAALAKYFTPRICAYMKVKGVIDEGKPIEENMKRVFEEYAFKDGDYRFKASGNEVEIEIVTKRCKVCPKGVGGAEIPGTACPIPHFAATCLSILTGKSWKAKRVNKGTVEKEGGLCKMKLEVS